MTTRLVVEGDPVRGVDRHDVTGDTTNPANPPTPPTLTAAYTGKAEYSYRGAVSTGLCDFVRIDGTRVATVSSGSELDHGESSGAHAGPAGTSWAPPLPLLPPGAAATGVTLLIVATVTISGSVGSGSPAATTGSGFVRAGGVAVLLDGDAFDVCGAPASPRVAVAAQGQDLVRVSG